MCVVEVKLVFEQYETKARQLLGVKSADELMDLFDIGNLMRSGSR